MYGIAMHNAIRVFLQHRLKGLPIEAGDVIGAFEESWSSEGFYSREHEERRFEEGRAALLRFVAREETSGRVPLAVERDFRFRLDRDVVVGRWDRIDEDRDGVVLVDSKTREIVDPEQAMQRARRSQRDGQLGLYALAYRETTGATPGRVQLHFVGSGVVGEAAVEATALERARARVAEAAAGIRAARFPARPEPSVCVRCPYNRFCPHSAARAGP
jgi:DNA helicase-2/ATP-dependent DNA helicase PcrA